MFRILDSSEFSLTAFHTVGVIFMSCQMSLVKSFKCAVWCRGSVGTQWIAPFHKWSNPNPVISNGVTWLCCCYYSNGSSQRLNQFKPCHLTRRFFSEDFFIYRLWKESPVPGPFPTINKMRCCCFLFVFLSYHLQERKKREFDEEMCVYSWFNCESHH